MFKTTLFTFLLMAAVAQGAVKELVPKLSSDNLDVQTQARLDLLAACSKASAPDAAPDARKAICLEMCQVLEGNHPVVSVIQPVLNNLERIGGEESVPTLVKLLNHKDQHIRDDARRALAVNPSPAAGQALGARLKMRKARNPRETAGFIYALGERREKGASGLIAAQLNSKNDEVFIAAVKALGMLSEEPGIRALAKQRSKETGFRLMEVNAALFASDYDVVFQKLYAHTESVDVRAVALLGLTLNGGLDLAAEAMSSGTPELQTAVIEAGLQLNDPMLYQLIADHLNAIPVAMQPQALNVLSHSGNRELAAAVEPYLAKDRPWEVQSAAADALAYIGTQQSVAVLLASGSGESRRALGMLNANGVDQALEAAVAKKGNDALRAVAVDALAIRGRQDLIPTFFKLAEKDDGSVAVAAVKAIGSIGGVDDLGQLTDLMVTKESLPVSRDILGGIVEIMRRSTEAEKSVEILVGRMDNASPRSQANMLQALVQTGSDAALKPVVNACRSSNEKLQKQAFKLLGGWKTDNAIPVMIELAGDDSVSVANHVVLMRGVSRLLAGQRRLNRKQAEAALAVCRRPEEKGMIQELIDKKK